ncbi:MAG: ATP-binding protein [Alphaproteobacteria bacterium]|nr:ATP-binding protein [Alphaproteobacteria bacterium]
MERFFEHNKHWQSLQQFEENDPQLRKLKTQVFVHNPYIIYELPFDIPGIYTLVGGRQIGKTTNLKQWMQYLLEKKNISSQDIFFMTGEIINDHLALIQLIQQYLNTPPKGPLRYLIVDEVTYIKNWDQGIKYLADMGAFESTVVVLTGSDSILIKEARMRFPGRRGTAGKVDFHLYPLSFYEVFDLKHKNESFPSIDDLHKEFENYLRHGGFLTAINDEAAKLSISTATYRTYSDWIRGDILKRGKNETFLREVLMAIIKTYGTQVTWNALADHTSINHHDTIREYVHLLEDMDVLFVQHALIEDKRLPAPKKAKKIIFKDPFIYHATRLWVFPSQVEDFEKIPSLVEAAVVSHYQRFYPCYYIKAEGEVDLAYVDQGRFFPIEVKWTQQLRPKDLKQVKKYPNALILTKSNIREGNIDNMPTQPVPLHLYDSYIREKLEEISQSKLPSPQQINLIEKILKRKSKPVPNEWSLLLCPSVNINCFAYALGLGSSEIYREIAREAAWEKPDRYASSDFIKHLLTKNILQPLDTPTANCLVLYLDEDGKSKHAGLLKQITPELMVESKWGDFDCIFEHGLWEVPKSYGTKAKYYAPLPIETVEEQFSEFCRMT